MRFSVIIPNYNNGEWIGKTLDSVINQTFQDFEIIVIDDLSTDNSVEVIRSKLRKQDTLIINESKRFNGGSRNVGILRAKGEYIICIDSDDWFIDNKVFEDVDKTLKGEDICFMGYLVNKGDVSLSIQNKHKSINDALMDYTCAIWTKVVKTKLLRETLFPEGTLFEDRIQHYQLMLKYPTFTNLGRESTVWNRTNLNSISNHNTALWTTYRFSYCGELYRLLQTLPEGEFKNYIRDELKDYMKQINEMADNI